MAHSVIGRIRESDARVLIVDNISWLNTSNVGANATLRLMKALKKIKTDHEISILVLAHTPKRALARSLTVNDLAGSKMLANFADNMFAIGHAHLLHTLCVCCFCSHAPAPAIAFRVHCSWRCRVGDRCCVRCCTHARWTATQPHGRRRPSASTSHRRSRSTAIC